MTRTKFTRKCRNVKGVRQRPRGAVSPLERDGSYDEVYVGVCGRAHGLSGQE